MDTTKNYSKTEQAFLDAYRSLEDACREHASCQVIDFERRMEDDSRQGDASKLRMCRTTRNFLVHDGPGFASVTTAMTKFVAEITKEVRLSGGTAKDVMVTAARYGVVQLNTTAADAAKAVKRSDVLIVNENGELVGVLDGRGFAKALAGKGPKTKLSELCAAFGMPKKIDIATPVRELPGHKCAVIKNGKLAGVINSEKAWSP